METIRLSLAECERNAASIGMSRRRFLLSLCGAATTLLTLNSCTREALEREPGGRYDVSPEATMDEDAARETLSGEEFVFDIQGHLLEYDLNPTVAKGGGKIDKAELVDCFNQTT